MKSISVNNVTIDIEDSPIGLSFSGGADSSLLLYIVMQHATTPIHLYTFASENKQWRNSVISVNVVNKCIDLTGNKNIYHHITYIERQSPEIIYPKMESMLVRDGACRLYTGMTKLPPKQIYKKFAQSLEDWLIDKRTDEKTYEEYSHNDKLYTPFVNLNKKDIAAMYDTLGITNTLYPVTNSCEGAMLDYNHCGKCWWCEERQWAFNK
jgi:7-cyano-7-deazaguanine synthase in queuosine biosynthesis